MKKEDKPEAEQAYLMKEIASDFAKFKNKILAVLVYGSYAVGAATPRSDIDICIIAGSREKAKQLYRETLSIQGKKPEYDIHIFELMPLYLKMRVIEEGKVVFSNNLPELYYYFYFFRKFWQDQAVNRIEVR